MYDIVIEDRADIELMGAIEYYQSLNITGLVEKFLNDYRKTLFNIQQSKFFVKKIDEFRVIPFERFPYIVFYKVYEVEQTIQIVSIFNSYQNPIKYPQ